jgi:hypothetical protein
MPNRSMRELEEQRELVISLIRRPTTYGISNVIGDRGVGTIHPLYVIL